EAAVDENVPLVGRYQVRGQILRPDVVHIADDLVRRERLVPLGRALSNGSHGQRQRGEKHGADLRIQKTDRLLGTPTNPRYFGSKITSTAGRLATSLASRVYAVM